MIETYGEALKQVIDGKMDPIDAVRYAERDLDSDEEDEGNPHAHA